MVCKLCWNLLKVRLDSNAWTCSSRHPAPLVVFSLPRVLIGKGASCWRPIMDDREAFFLHSDASLCECPWRCVQTRIVSRHCPGSRGGIPRAAANPVHQEGHSRVLAKPLCFLVLRLRVRFFLVPKNQQYLKRAH